MIKLLDFWATWCPPCKQMNPIIEEIEKENPQFLIEKIDIDTQPEMAEKYGVMSIPTYVFEKDGKEVSRILGATSKGSIIEKMRE
jgi:thioredoxin 1